MTRHGEHTNDRTLSSWSAYLLRRVLRLIPRLVFSFVALAQISSAQRVVEPTGSNTETNRSPGDVFRECPECPEMVIIPGGDFMMGSSAAEKSWAASHGASLGAVADESPQHKVSVPTFALGKYDVTRAEYAAFVRETGYPAGDGCGVDSFKWEKRPGLTWQHPGVEQTGRDPVVCVSWQDACACVAWLNRKARHGAASGDGPYRLPSEIEWEYGARAGNATPFWWGESVVKRPRMPGSSRTLTATLIPSAQSLPTPSVCMTWLGMSGNGPRIVTITATPGQPQMGARTWPLRATSTRTIAGANASALTAVARGCIPPGSSAQPPASATQPIFAT
jgi:formylglycine-generating enzyme required for sulfatase activity